MDLEAIAPILEQILKKSLEEKRYRFVVSATIAAVNKNRNPSIIIKVLFDLLFIFIIASTL